MFKTMKYGLVAVFISGCLAFSETADASQYESHRVGYGQMDTVELGRERSTLCWCLITEKVKGKVVKGYQGLVASEPYQKFRKKWLGRRSR